MTTMNSEISPMQQTRMEKAKKLAIAQIQEAQDIQKTIHGAGVSADATLAIAQILATNYLAVVQTGK
jgi:hypothetical protein